LASQNSAIYARQEKTLAESNKQGKSTYKLNLNLGQFRICYTNEILKYLFDLIIEMKQLNVFRDVNLPNLLSRDSRKTTA